MTIHTDAPPQRLAAAAPQAEADDQPDAAPADPLDSHLDELAERWGAWCRTRRFYGRPSAPASLLGKLTSKGRAAPPTGGPDAIASPELAAFHLAVLAQPDGLARKVFELHYLHRVSNVKSAAAMLEIGRQHWYTLLRGFRRQAYSASREILQVNVEAGEQLASRRDPA